MSLDNIELVSQNLAKDYEYESAALIEVIKFTVERKLIVFGGYAIDCAMHLKGSRIYPEGEKPDVDVYSKDMVKDAYDLADLLKSKGFIGVSAINGIHLQTMRVVTNFIGVMDIGHVPEEVFNKIPTINYKGMRIINPNFQRIDMHYSLSFPFESCPRETIFNRWAKDVKRFNVIDEYYPLEKFEGYLKLKDAKPPKMNKHKIYYGKLGDEYALHGFAAYAAIVSSYLKITETFKAKSVENLSTLKIACNDEYIEYESPETHATIVSSNFTTTAYYETNKDKIKRWNSYVEMIPKSYSDENLIVFSTEERLLSISTVEINEIEFSCACINYVLMYMFAHYIKTGEAYYLKYYRDLCLIINAVEAMKEMDSYLENSPFSLSILTLGQKNIDNAYKISFLRDIKASNDREYFSMLSNELNTNIPVRYFEGKPRPPPFDHKSNNIFNRVGNQLE